MQEIYNLITRALRDRLPTLTTETVVQTFATWELIPLTRKDSLVGVILRKENEVHIIIDPEFHNTICFLKQCKKVLAETIAKYGYAYTKVVDNHKIGHRLAKILGFNEAGHDGTSTHYKLEEI